MSTWEDLTTLCEMGQEAEDAEILEELKTELHRAGRPRWRRPG